jgi:hypothetical protein
MATADPDLSRQIDVTVGRVDVLHRLALAVRPRGAVNTGGMTHGVRVGLETPRARARRPRRRGDATPLDPVLRSREVGLDGGAAFVLRHGDRGLTQVTLRVHDPARRWQPRRFRVPLWTAKEVEAVDANPPPASGPIPAESRLLRPWLLPGPAYLPPRTATGVRLRITRGSVAVRWPRVEAFGLRGHRVGWAHGDEHGQLLLLVRDIGVLPQPPPATFDVAIRIHTPHPDPRRRPPVDPLDPLADLTVEDMARSSAPPTNQDLDNDLLRGITRPSDYVTVDQDVVVTLTVGEVVAFSHDIPSPPQP